MSERSEVNHVPEKVCKPAAPKRKRSAIPDTEPTPVRSSKRRRMASRAVREAAADGPSAPVTAPIPKKRRTAPCRNSPAFPGDAREDIEILLGMPVRMFKLLRAVAVIAYTDSEAGI